MRALVTGGAGFIGSNLVDRLLRDGHHVTVYDNFSTGRQDFLTAASQSEQCRIVTGDLLDTAALDGAMAGIEIVFHLAANADVRFGTHHPSRDLEQNTIATFNVLDAMRRAGAKKIVFSSTGSIYGEPDVFPTPEDAPFPVQTSLYGASKLAGEGLLQAYAEGFGLKACIFRFVSILGPRYTHGHVFDFIKKLNADPSRLPILGNGKQCKSYLHVDDCLDAILTVIEKTDAKVGIYNLGTDEYCEVNSSVGWICERLKLTPKLDYAGGERGWIGDSPFIFLDTKKVRALGWTPKYSIQAGVISTVDWLKANPWVFDAR